jgi:hypothetical protein
LEEVNKTADIPSRLAHYLGQRNIEKGGQTYEVDRRPSYPSSPQFHPVHGLPRGRHRDAVTWTVVEPERGIELRAYVLRASLNPGLVPGAAVE